jgi:hypothetical protein
LSLRKQSMETKSAILNELREISPVVADIRAGLTYQVPDGYFDGLAAAILNRVRTEGLSAKDELQTLSPLLSGLSKKSPYQVPESYFEVSPVLMQLRNKETYTVPEGYFENLSAGILDKVQERRPAKVVSMNTGRKFMRYAAAAVVAGVMAVAGWFYFANNSTGTGNSVAKVEQLSEDNKISDEEIATYLESETLPVVTAAVFPENEEINASDIKEMLSDVSDDELQQFVTL